MSFQVSNFNKYFDSSKFIEFCKHESMNDSDPAAVNMWNENWTESNETLPYILFKNKRFCEPRGEFFLLRCNDQIIGCSGIYISDFSKEIAIGGCRTWINKNFRNQSLMRDYLLPIQKRWAIDRGLKVIALTFNDYNKNMIKIWKRIRFGEKRSPRTPEHIFYNNFNELNFPVLIQHTKQWLIYENLDSQSNFDWQKIRVDS